MKPRSTGTSATLSIHDALLGSAPLARLFESMRDSKARFDAVRPVIPRLLAPHIKPGPLDAEGWTLLADNTAVAAKLRQLAPRLEQQLRDCGWSFATVRIKVASPVE